VCLVVLLPATAEFFVLHLFASIFNGCICDGHWLYLASEDLQFVMQLRQPDTFFNEARVQGTKMTT
jgi:hypothetical protein